MYERQRYDPLLDNWSPDEQGGSRQYLLGPRNQERYPLAHRLDLSLTRIGRDGSARTTPYLSIANVYGAMNPAFYVFNYTGTPASVPAHPTSASSRRSGSVMSSSTRWAILALSLVGGCLEHTPLGPGEDVVVVHAVLNPTTSVQHVDVRHSRREVTGALRFMVRQ